MLEGLDVLCEIQKIDSRLPGNVRELENVLKQSLLHATGPVLTSEFLPDSIRHWRAADGNQSKAARLLGITRGNLRNKIRALKIHIDRFSMVHSDADQVEHAVP